MTTTYSVELWDHEIEPEGGWSAELACEHLEGPNTGLGPAALREALRALRRNGWSNVSMLVGRDEQPACR